jgi:NhaP-type Na+/H+ or K+/H+ antiporter
LVGLVFGLIHAFTLKELRHISHKPHYEIGLTIFFGLLSYLIGEVFEISGIISIL